MRARASTGRSKPATEAALSLGSTATEDGAFAHHHPCGLKSALRRSRGEGPALTYRMGEGESSSVGRRIQPSWKLSRFGIGIPSPVGREGQGEGRLVRNSLRSSTVLAQFLTEKSAGITNHESRITNHE